MLEIDLYEKPSKVSLTGNPIVFQLHANNANYYSFFKVIMEVLLWDGTAYTSISKDAVSVDDDGIADFNIQALLQNRIKGKFTYPESKYNLMLEHADLSGKFKIKYYWEGWDQSNNPLHGEVNEPTDIFYFIEGGQPDIIRQLQTEIDSGWYQEHIEDKKFLTNQPTNKTIHPEQCEKLYWLVREGCSSLKINLQVYLNDGSDAISQPLSIGVTPFNIVEITATLKHLVNDVSLLASYKVWLTDQSNAIASEVFEYTLDHNWYERNDFLPFANSLGAFDTMWLHGQRSVEFEGERKTYVKQLPGIRPRLEDKSFVSTRAKIARNNKSNTGWLTPEQAEYLSAEFLGSDQVMCLVNDQLWPVGNLTDKARPSDDKEDLNALDIEWQLGDKARYYGKFNKEIKHPLPPQWNDIEACFCRLKSGKLVDIKSGKEALVVDDSITFPQLNNDVFNKTNPAYWLADIVSTQDARNWLFSELTGTYTVMYSIPACRDLLFFKNINGDNIKTTFPIITYKTRRTATQKDNILAYQEEYFYVTEDGAIVTDNGELVTDKYK